MKKPARVKSELRNIADALALIYGIPKQKRSEPGKVLDVLIATKLSQNTTDKSSYQAYSNLRQKFGSWYEVADASEKEIKECIKVCGLANTKARDIKNMLNEMLKRYGTLDLKFLGKLDDEKVYGELLEYGGIGLKTISCVLVFALGRDVFPVDTHVHRTLNRLGIVIASTPEKTFEQVSEILPEGRKYELHTNLIKFGRNICRAKNPLCSACIFYGICTFGEKQKFRRSVQKKMPENNFLILEEI